MADTLYLLKLGERERETEKKGKKEKERGNHEEKTP